MYRLHGYMCHILGFSTKPGTVLSPLVKAAVSAQRAISVKTHNTWWNNSWRILGEFGINPNNMNKGHNKSITDILCKEFERFWSLSLWNPASQDPNSTLIVYIKHHLSWKTI